MFKVYKGQVVPDDEEHKLSLDYNDRIQERIQEFQQQIIKRKDDFRQQKIDDFFAAIEVDEDGNTIYPSDEEGHVLLPLDEDGTPLIVMDDEGNPVINQVEEAEEEAEEAFVDMEAIQAQADEMIANAREEADAIIAEAQEQAEALKSHYEEEGKKSGYQEGLADAMNEFNAKKDELEAERQQLQAEFDEKERAMESELVDVITEVMERFFLVQFGNKKDLLLHLIDNALINIENSREFLIKVNDENFDFLNQYKSQLQEKVGNDLQLDIIRDPVLDVHQCLIETDGGVFDCSLDVELDNLVKDLKSLSM
ncbi:flagellar assembly protein FliH [Lachnospiraceae bacterium XBD2001]|nr:flagellar assembly protein FliH [Lachnospiraceae bacterium XBD2001]